MWKICCFFVLLLFSCHSADVLVEGSKKTFATASTFQLIAPRFETDSILFRKSTKVALELDFPETEIRYTLDGEEVTEKSELYNTSLFIDKSIVLRARAFHSECKSSGTLEQAFFKVSNVMSIAEVRVEPLFDERYAGTGLQSLTDLRKGSPSFRGDKRWLGFQNKEINMQLYFPEKISLETLTLSTLADERSWIFLPEKVELYAGEEQIAHWDKKTLENTSETGLHLLKFDFSAMELKKLNIRILCDSLPKGHNGYGDMSWFFIDEIFAE